MMTAAAADDQPNGPAPNSQAYARKAASAIRQRDAMVRAAFPPPTGPRSAVTLATAELALKRQTTLTTAPTIFPRTPSSVAASLPATRGDGRASRSVCGWSSRRPRSTLRSTSSTMGRSSTQPSGTSDLPARARATSLCWADKTPHHVRRPAAAQLRQGRASARLATFLTRLAACLTSPVALPLQVASPATSLPIDDQFFLPPVEGDKTRKPNLAFLKDHLFREGRVTEEQALWLLEECVPPPSQAVSERR
jgi:hypothetical protein